MEWILTIRRSATARSVIARCSPGGGQNFLGAPQLAGINAGTIENKKAAAKAAAEKKTRALCLVVRNNLLVGHFDDRREEKSGF